MQDALWCLGDYRGQDPASVYRGEVVAGEPAGLEGFGQQAWRWRRQARDTGHHQIDTVGLSRLIPCLEIDLELNQSAHHCRPMMCRWRLLWVRLGLVSNSRN